VSFGGYSCSGQGFIYTAENTIKDITFRSKNFPQTVLLVIGLLLGVSVPKEKERVSKFPHDFLPSAVFLLFAGLQCSNFRYKAWEAEQLKKMRDAAAQLHWFLMFFLKKGKCVQNNWLF